MHEDDITRLCAPDIELVGFADLGALKVVYPDLFEYMEREFPFAVSLGKVLLGGVLDSVRDGPTPLYFSHYRQVNYLLDRVALRVASYIEARGYTAVPVPASQYISRRPYTGQICHRRIGWQAGHGTRGLNNLLVHPVYGSAVRYVSVLTDMPLAGTGPVEEGCTGCGRCREACPAGAVADTPEGFRMDACVEKLEEFRKIPFVGQHVCGVCVSVCRGKR